MAFDASVISSIPDNAPDPIKAKGDAYTLASLIDNQQLDRMKLNSAKSEQADLGKIKEVLNKTDISTFEGQNKAADAATRINPKLGMDLQRNFAQRQSAQYDKQDQELKILGMRHDYISGALDNVLAEADNMRRRGATDAMVNATIMRSVLGAKEQLQQQTLPDGKPVWDPQFDKALASGPLNYDRIRSLEMQSNKGQELVKQRLAERHQQVGEAQESERERHDRATEGLANRKETTKEATDSKGIITDDASDLAAQRLLNGEKASDVLANFGRGKQGPENIAKVQNRFAQLAKEQGMSSQDITNRRIEMQGIVKEEQVAGAISGKIRYAEKEIGQIAPKALEASASVPRGSFVPWNRLKLYGEKQLSDPNLKRLKSYLTTLSNSYDLLAARGGTDKDKRAHNRELLDSADSPETLKVAIDAITQEAALSETAATESLKRTGAPTPSAAAKSDTGKVVDWSSLK